MLLLLDIDGVMVPEKSWSSPELLKDGFPAFSSKATSVLNNLIVAKDTVMLTTSHKHNYTLNEWKEIFERRGININKIKRLPKNDDNVNRLNEILNWHSKNKLWKNFIIIDDDSSLNSLPPELKERLIQTSPTVGLTDDKYGEILRVVRTLQ